MSGREGRVFEVLQVDVVKYEKKGVDVVMENFNARIGWKQRNIQIITNGKRLLELLTGEILR